MASMSFANIDEYLKTLPEETRHVFQKIRETIARTVPSATEAFSYGVPAFKLNGKDLILYAAFKKHIGLYPTPSVIVKFKKELAGYKTSEGTIQFQLDEPIPYELISRIVKFRAEGLGQ